MYDMFSEANKAAAKIRELYESFVRQGFTADQAMELTKTVLNLGRVR